MTSNYTLESNVNSSAFYEPFHPMKWLQEMGKYLTVCSDISPLQSERGKKSVQTTVLSEC